MIAVHSVRTRLLLAVLATTATALLVALTAMMAYEVRDYRQMLTADLTTQADLVARSSMAALVFADAEASREHVASLTARPRIVVAAFYDAAGRLLAAQTRPGYEATLPAAIPIAAEARVEGDQVVLVHPVTEADKLVGAVLLRGDYALTERLVHYALIAGAVLVLSLLAAWLVWVWLGATVTGPILEMRDVAQRVVESRDFGLRTRKRNDDEIGYLAEAFNGMLAEIGSRTEALERSNDELAAEVTERERAQEARARAEEDLRTLNTELESRVANRTEELGAAVKELESFSYSVSHDLRAPVRAIAGFSRLLAEQHAVELTPEAQRKLGIVRSEAARMGALIDDLLAFSRLGRQSLQVKPVDMTELVRASIDTLNAGHSGTLPEVRIGALPAAHGDRSLLAQVWTNLIANAYKFSARREHPIIEIGANDAGNETVYFVRDNGVGFDPRFVSKLFGVFQRLHDAADYPGTGVGLALVQRIVSRHGGRVWAEGQLDAGATFFFSLPQEKA